MKNYLKAIFIYFFLFSNICYSQLSQYERNEGPFSLNIGIKCLFFGGLIWFLGILLFQIKHKNVTVFEKIATIFCVIGGIIAIFGLLMLGF